MAIVMSHGTIQFPYQFQHALVSHLDFKVCLHSTICFLHFITNGSLGRIDPSVSLKATKMDKELKTFTLRESAKISEKLAGF